MHTLPLLHTPVARGGEQRAAVEQRIEALGDGEVEYSLPHRLLAALLFGCVLCCAGGVWWGCGGWRTLKHKHTTEQQQQHSSNK